jgi:multidrug efflux pump subunit AcrB
MLCSDMSITGSPLTVTTYIGLVGVSGIIMNGGRLMAFHALSR